MLLLVEKDANGDMERMMLPHQILIHQLHCSHKTSATQSISQKRLQRPSGTNASPESMSLLAPSLPDATGLTVKN